MINYIKPGEFISIRKKLIKEQEQKNKENREKILFEVEKSINEFNKIYKGFLYIEDDVETNLNLINEYKKKL